MKYKKIIIEALDNGYEIYAQSAFSWNPDIHIIYPNKTGLINWVKKSLIEKDFHKHLKGEI